MLQLEFEIITLELLYSNKNISPSKDLVPMKQYTRNDYLTDPLIVENRVGSVVIACPLLMWYFASSRPGWVIQKTIVEMVETALDSVWNCLLGHNYALKRSPGINRKSRVRIVSRSRISI